MPIKSCLPITKQQITEGQSTACVNLSVQVFIFDVDIFKLCYFSDDKKWNSLLFFLLYEGNLCVLCRVCITVRKLDSGALSLNSADSQSWNSRFFSGWNCSQSWRNDTQLQLTDKCIIMLHRCITELSCISAVSLRSVEPKCQDIRPWLFCYIVSLCFTLSF